MKSLTYSCSCKTYVIRRNVRFSNQPHNRAVVLTEYRSFKTKKENYLDVIHYTVDDDFSETT